MQLKRTKLSLAGAVLLCGLYIEHEQQRKRLASIRDPENGYSILVCRFEKGSQT
jgi:hypothetical protein